MRMKNFLVLLSLALTILMVSCTRYETANMGAHRYVYRGKKVGIEQKVNNQWISGLPVSYDKIEGVLNKSVYLATVDGQTYAFDIGFQQLFDGAEVIKADTLMSKSSAKARKYYGKMFASGNYIKAYTSKGVFALFIDPYDKHVSFGGFEDILPACSGLIYRQNGLWNAKLSSVGAGAPGYSPNNVYWAAKPFVEKCEQILEVRQVTSPWTSGTSPEKAKTTWFAKKGGVWISFNGKGVKLANVNKALLNKALSLTPKTTVKGERYTVFSGQRVGTEEASVVFL